MPMVRESLLRRALPILGSLLLFLSWVVQQTLFDRWNSKLASIGGAEAVFHTYRSNNAVFRALRATAPQQTSEIEQQQETNYNRGRELIERQLDPENYKAAMERARAGVAAFVSLSQLSVDQRILIVYDALQIALSIERSSLETRKRTAEYVFYLLYAVGSLMLLVGAVLKARTELREEAES